MRRGSPLQYVCFKCFTKQYSVTHVSGDIHNPKDTDLVKCNCCGYTFTRKDWRELMTIRPRKEDTR